jgi:hypothetical protein
MDALGRSWLHYGVHAVSKTTVGSRVCIVFPEYEFEPHLYEYFSLFVSPSGLSKNNGSPFKPFLDHLKMKRLSSDLAAFHAH